VILGAEGSFTVKQGSFSATTHCATVSGKMGTTAGCLVNQLTAVIVMFSAILQPDDRNSPHCAWTAAITLQRQANGTGTVMPTIGGYFQSVIHDQATIPYKRSEHNIYFR
jgi:hypothetical protein